MADLADTLSAEPPRGSSHALAEVGQLDRLRRSTMIPIVCYFWMCAACVALAAALVGVSVAAVALPLAVIGAIATRAALHAPGMLSTRLTLTVAINATWMFGLYVASAVHDGAYMLEVHMFYFINTAAILAFACWRSVVLTTVAALAHHLVLGLLQPGYVWPVGAHIWIHFGNHAVLGTLNCLGASLIALSLQRALTRMESLTTEAQDQAVRDALTGLLNRRGLREGVDALGAREDTPDEITILQIDLDGFKQINDTSGHAAGDALLVKVARRLTELAPETGLVARMGGDEFVLVLPGCPAEEVDALVAALFEWTRRPCRIEGRDVRFGASVGLVRAPIRDADIGQLLADADIALYAAKTGGKNRICTFDAEMRARTIAGKELADDVLRGLEAGEFEPFFQTQHDAATGAVTGVEALVRWRHPTRGLLEPRAFLEAAGSVGRMADLDLAMMRRAVDIVRGIEAEGGQVGELAINVSFSRLRDPGLVESVLMLPAMRARLTFEIVETVVFDELEQTELWALDRLRERGVGIAIDDFGTGHASIIGLTRLRPDKLKIDRQMVMPMLVSPEHRALVRSMVEMACCLGIYTVAEGVETEDEARILRQMGVCALQGFAYGQPMPADALRERLVRAADAHPDAPPAQASGGGAG
ncbi:MAG: EAL domain [Rhodobacteraceae bacterium HLUCCA09]|nr:MAG: EAL domain [Rhodobacteraceae bacterium HLUCCA09]